MAPGFYRDLEEGTVMSVKWLFSLTLLALVVTLAACGGVLEVGVERTPTPDHSATATVVALATENARLATQVATLAASTPTPTPSLGKLAYVQGGDIWVKTLPDGESQRLTTDGRNSQPCWSHSGEWLAFRKGEYQVWLMSADGKDARSLNEGAAVDAFAWAPADDRLAYVAAAGLQVISAGSATAVTLAPPSPPGYGPGRMGRLAWSPDGAWIACEWQEWQPSQPTTYQGLWKVSANGEQLAELYASGAPAKGEAVLAGWSLDGQYILFWQGDILSASMLADGVPLYSLPVGGGEPIQLVDTVLVHDDFLAPAPQVNRLAATAGSYRATWTNKRLAVVQTSGGEPTWLTAESVVAFSPTWSPDGNRLAFVSMPDRGDLVGGDDARLGMMERHIWIMNADGSGQRQITNDPDYRDERPLGSADGNYLLFARIDAEGRVSLWLIPVEGGDPYQTVEELTPLPGPASGWFGYYGHVDWDQIFAWQRGPSLRQESPAGKPSDSENHPQAQELLSKHGWSTTGKQATYQVTLPKSFEHHPGEFPIPIYWAYNNELSKAIGLDLSPYLGQRIEATVYELQEELPEFLRPYTKARAVVVSCNGKIIGAWIDKGRHYAFACSLDRKPIEEITGMDWSEWLVASGVVNPANEVERELAALTPEEIITRYYQALNDHDDERAYACLTRRSLTDFLFSNMDDLALYHSSYGDNPLKETIYSVQVIGIGPLPDAGNPEGVLRYKVDIDVKYEAEIVSRSGHNVRFMSLEKEIEAAGWRITGIGTGP